MSLVLLGSVSLAQALPGAAQMQGELGAVVSAEVPNLQLDLGDIQADLGSVQAELPSVSADLGDVNAQLSAQLSANTGITATLALGPAVAIAGAIAAIASGQALLALTASGPGLLTSLQGSLSAGLSLAAGLTAKVGTITAKVGSLTAKIGTLTAKIAGVNARIGSLNASAALSANLGALLGSGGVVAYRYDGPFSGLRDAVNTTINVGAQTAGIPLSSPVWATLFVTSDPATWTAMQAVLKTS